MTTNQKADVEFYAKMLHEKYGTLALTTPQTSEVTSRAEITLKLDRAEGIGIPYSKFGTSVKYLILDVAKYIVKNQMKVMS